MSAEREPTIQDVLDAIETLRSDLMYEIETRLAALAQEVEILGRDTRAIKTELLAELPPAVVEAVARARVGAC